jgi:hypothetical protein
MRIIFYNSEFWFLTSREQIKFRISADIFEKNYFVLPVTKEFTEIYSFYGSSY